MWIDKYSDFLIAFLHSNVVLAPLFILTLEEVGLPTLIPGDAILAYVGAVVKSAGPSVSLVTALVIAVISVLIGSTILFFLSRRWGRFIVTRLGKFIFLKESHIENAEKLFAKYGVLTIIFGRHIPGMRAPVTIFAAISGIRYRTFILCTFVSTLVWAIFWLYFGHHYGANIQKLIHKHLPASITIIVIIVLAFFAFHFIGEYRERKRNKDSKKITDK